MDSKLIEKVKLLEEQCDQYSLSEHSADHDRQKAWDYAESLLFQITSLKKVIAIKDRTLNSQSIEIQRLNKLLKVK